MYTILTPGQAQKETDALIAPATTEEYEARTHHVLSLLAGEKIPHTAEEKRSVAQRAKKIIDENFANPMMGLYLVSEQLKVSNSYLSTTFKDTYGINIIPYLNKQRVERAKSLILSTDMNIKEIAHAVGYSSDINFIRVFKKLENCTPTTLRKKD